MFIKGKKLHSQLLNFFFLPGTKTAEPSAPPPSAVPGVAPGAASPTPVTPPAGGKREVSETGRHCYLYVTNGFWET